MTVLTDITKIMLLHLILNVHSVIQAAKPAQTTTLIIVQAAPLTLFIFKSIVILNKWETVFLRACLITMP